MNPLASRRDIATPLQPRQRHIFRPHEHYFTPIIFIEILITTSSKLLTAEIGGSKRRDASVI